MKSASASNDLELKSRRRRCVVLTVASLSACIAAPALAEVRFNPFFNGQAATEQTERVLDQSPCEVDPAPRSSRSLPLQDARPKRLPQVTPTTSSPPVSQPVGNTLNDELESNTDELLDFALPGPIQPPVTHSEPLASAESDNAIEFTAVPAPEIVFTPKVQEASSITRSLEQKAETEEQHPLLQSTTAKSTYRQSRQYLDQAINEYSVGAWASAEASAWMALRGLAEAVDITQRSDHSTLSALEDLSFANMAIRESRDFLGLPASAIARVRMSHQTNILNSSIGEPLNASRASDLYLDDARVRLGRLAAQSADAAEALDLLAAIYLGRNDVRLMPGPVSLCLRRAALQGQPNNGSLATRLGMQLADTGLYDEAYLVLQHAYALAPTEETSEALQSVARHCGRDSFGFASTQTDPKSKTTSQRPDVIQLSPSEFAAISQPVMQVAAIQTDATDSQKFDQPEAADTSQTSYDPKRDDESDKSSPLKRFTGSFTRLWK